MSPPPVSAAPSYPTPPRPSFSDCLYVGLCKCQHQSGCFCWLGDGALLPAALLTGERTSFILIFVLLPPLLSIHPSVLLFFPFFLSLLSWLILSKSSTFFSSPPCFFYFLLLSPQSFPPNLFFILLFFLFCFVHTKPSSSLVHPSFFSSSSESKI